jgi:hypothetical protein
MIGAGQNIDVCSAQDFFIELIAFVTIIVAIRQSKATLSGM